MPILRSRPQSRPRRRPTTVVLVVDRSLSMEEEDRIGSLKQAVATFLKVLPRGLAGRGRRVRLGGRADLPVHRRRRAGPGTPSMRLTPARGDPLLRRGGRGARADRQGAGPPRRAGPDRRRGHLQPVGHLDSVIAAGRGELGLPVHTLGLGSEDEIESDALRRLAVDDPRPVLPGPPGRPAPRDLRGARRAARGRATAWSTGPTAASPTAPSGRSGSSTGRAARPARPRSSSRAWSSPPRAGRGSFSCSWPSSAAWPALPGWLKRRGRAGPLST